MGGFGLSVLLWIAGILGAFVLAGVIYQSIGMHRDARRFPAPGRFVRIGDARIHINEGGAGDPPIIFDAGIAATSLSWRSIQPDVAQFARTIAYDRSGLGWSDSIDSPRDIWTLVDELRKTLDADGVPNQRVIVAHSFGGLIATAYALRFPEEIAAMVLVDPAAPDEWATPGRMQAAMLRRGILLARFGELLARLGVVRFALDLLSSGARTLPKLIARASSGQSGSGFIDRMVGQIRKLPPEVWPMIQAHWCDPKCFRSAARQLAALPSSATGLLEALDAGPIKIPFVLLSAGDASPAQRAGHQRLVERSLNGCLEVVEGSGHWIMLDQPELVVNAIRLAVLAIRSQPS